MSKHTPLPWFVRELSRDGEMQDCFVAAKDVNGFAYDAEILGDDEYREGAIERKFADCNLIVRAVNCHDELVKALEKVLHELETVLPSSGLVHSERQAIIDANAILAKVRA